jgi:hypothetical protein
MTHLSKAGLRALTRREKEYSGYWKKKITFG